jgi:hypothetical protein
MMKRKHIPAISAHLAALAMLSLWPASSAEAQAPSATKPQLVPRQPPVSPAPARSEWTVRMSTDILASEAEEERPGAAEAASQQRTVRAIQFSKDTASKAYRLRTRFSDGGTEDEWIVSGSHVAERAGKRGYYIVGNETSIARDLSRADFPELAWVQMSHYRGVKAHRGKPAFHFTIPFDEKTLTGDQAQIMDFMRRSDPKATPSKVFKPKLAEVSLYVDAVTQLPMTFNDGLNVRRYTFQQPAEERLQPPAEIVDFLKTRNEALRIRLTPPAGPGAAAAPK